MCKRERERERERETEREREKKRERKKEEEREREKEREGEREREREKVFYKAITSKTLNRLELLSHEMNLHTHVHLTKVCLYIH